MRNSGLPKGPRPPAWGRIPAEQPAVHIQEMGCRRKSAMKPCRPFQFTIDPEDLAADRTPGRAASGGSRIVNNAAVPQELPSASTSRVAGIAGRSVADPALRPCDNADSPHEAHSHGANSRRCCRDAWSSWFSAHRPDERRTGGYDACDRSEHRRA